MGSSRKGRGGGGGGHLEKFVSGIFFLYNFVAFLGYRTTPNIPRPPSDLRTTDIINFLIYYLLLNIVVCITKTNFDSLHVCPSPLAFCIYSKNLQATHTWNLVTLPNIFWRMPLWKKKSNLILSPLTAHLGQPVHFLL